MSEHGIKGLVGQPPKDIELMATMHMIHVHRSVMGRCEKGFRYNNEFMAHILYLLELRKQSKPLKFPER